MGEKGRPQPVDDLFFVTKAFDRLDVARFDLADGGQTGADRLAVDQHRAGAAIAGVAADLDSGQLRPRSSRKAWLSRSSGEVARRIGAPLRVKETPSGTPGARCSIKGRPLRLLAGHAAFDRPARQGQCRVAAIIGAGAHIVDRRSAPARSSAETLSPRPAPAPWRRKGLLDGGQPFGRRRRTAARPRRRRVAHQPLSTSSSAADHDDRDDEIAPRAEVSKRPSCIVSFGAGTDDRRNDLVAGEGGATIAGDEFGEREAPHAPAA